MSRIKIPYTENPTRGNEHGTAKRGRPFLFQILSPVVNDPLYPVVLALHANPESLDERMTKSKTIAMTRGGYVEWIWPDELDVVSCQASTGAFISPDIGLTAGGDKPSFDGTSFGRKGTIAWERQEDLLELFRNNGMVFNMLGEPVIRGRVMMMYDRGIYIGHFGSFSVNEDDMHAYSFELNWDFTVEQVIYRFPVFSADQLDQSTLVVG